LQKPNIFSRKTEVDIIKMVYHSIFLVYGTVFYGFEDRTAVVMVFFQIPAHMKAPNCAKHTPRTTVPVLLHGQTLMIVPDKPRRVRVHEA
jgi:hypothetical protein